MLPSSIRAFALLIFLPFVLLSVANPVTATAQPPPALTAPEPRLSWPLTPAPDVLRPFEPPASPYGPGHRGVDLRATTGQSVLSADTGVVVFAGLLAGRGVVSIDHDMLRTTYEPVDPLVAVGEQVYAGQVIGTVMAGHPGCPVSACLHWGVRRGEEYLNPLVLVGEHFRVRLKPWDGDTAIRPPVR
ncbi:MAG: M23 family metallopeptidase [Haloechinothrix sp.]